MYLPSTDTISMTQAMTRQLRDKVPPSEAFAEVLKDLDKAITIYLAKKCRTQSTARAYKYDLECLMEYSGRDLSPIGLARFTKLALKRPPRTAKRLIDTAKRFL